MMREYILMNKYTLSIIAFRQGILFQKEHQRGIMAHFIISVLFQTFDKTSTAVHLNQPTSYSQFTSH